MEREQELTKILEAFSRLRQTQDWSTVQELYFKPQIVSIESQLLSESQSPKIDDSKLYKLQGEWQRVKLNDADRVIERLTAELKGIKQNNQINYES